MMALINWEGRQREPVEEPFIQLQKALIEREHDILESLRTIPVP
jgi:hypothetical protein